MNYEFNKFPSRWSLYSTSSTVKCLLVGNNFTSNFQQHTRGQTHTNMHIWKGVIPFLVNFVGESKSLFFFFFLFSCLATFAAFNSNFHAGAILTLLLICRQLSTWISRELSQQSTVTWRWWWWWLW